MRKAFLSSIALRSLAASLVALAAACGASPQAEPPPAAPDAPPPAAPEAAAPASPPAPAADAPKAATPRVEPVLVVKDAALALPESVLYEATADVYLVSNINGAPAAADNNGYISKVSPDGKIVEAKWIAGGAKGVKLDAPKGLAIAEGTLYVADLTVVRMFELKTGKPKGEVKLPGSTFVNDLAAGPDGKIWATDTGVRANEKGDFEPTKTDAVWVIEKGQAKAFAKGEELGQPNGIALVNNAPWVVTLGTGELYRLDEKGKRADVQKLPKGKLDGIIAVGDTILVSSWEASTILRGKPKGEFAPFAPEIKGGADMGFDTKRSRMLVPILPDGAIAIYEVK